MPLTGHQFLKFGIVGIANTLIDFAILNLLILSFKATSGLPLVLVNTASFLAASLNSYIFNKRWTFSRGRGFSLRQYLLFLAAVGCGLLINNLIVVSLTLDAMTPTAVPKLLWTNITKVIATGITMAWNFILLRYGVFAKSWH